MSDKNTTKTRKRRITITNERLKTAREGDGEMATMLRMLPDAEAKKILQRMENAVEKSSKTALDNDEAYQAARKHFESCKNTYYRTRDKLTVQEVNVPNPDFDPDAPESEGNPRTITIERNGFESRRVALLEKIADEDRKEAEAAEQVADGSDPNVPEGILHRNMREARDRKRALARKAMGLNGSDQETPDDVLNDGE